MDQSFEHIPIRLLCVYTHLNLNFRCANVDPSNTQIAFLFTL